MSKPKLLSIFEETTESTAYSRTNNPVTVIKSGSSLVVDRYLQVYDKAVLTFKSPCACQGLTDIRVSGITYTLVDSLGNTLSEDNEYFIEGASVSVIIDTKNNKAHILTSGEKIHCLDEGEGANSLVGNDTENNRAVADYSNAFGVGTKATKESQTSIGRYNKETEALLVVGDGIEDASRSNAFEVHGKSEDKEAEAYVGDKKLATEDYVTDYVTDYAKIKKLATEDYVTTSIEEYVGDNKLAPMQKTFTNADEGKFVTIDSEGKLIAVTIPIGGQF